MIKNLEKLILAIFFIGILAVSGFIYFNKNRNGATDEHFLSSSEAAEKTLQYINENIVQNQATASLIDVIDGGQVYKVRIKIGENEYESYISKDGKYLFPDGYDLSLDLSNSNDEGQDSSGNQEISTSEKPDVKLFIMSYCPYGLQAQKMFLPVYNLLKEKAQMGVYFVNYIMHEKQEIDENLRQYCIQEEEKEKYDDYLLCFVKDGSFEQCLSDAKIDKEKLENCIATTDKEYSIYSQYGDRNTWLNGRFPKFDVHTTLNQEYGIGGSPTMVINDKVVEVNPRSPENFKKLICQAFDSPPQECSQALSDAAFSPGFGLEEGGSSGGDCGP